MKNPIKQNTSSSEVVQRSSVHPDSGHFGLSIREICFFSLYGALMFVLKMAMAPLPNIEPVSLMVVVLAATVGWKGYWSVCIYIALEYLTWGLQLWSIGYLYIWAVLYAISILTRKESNPFVWALVTGFFGLFFGALSAIPYLFISGWNAALSWWLAGIPFDLLHAGGNFVLTLALFRPVSTILAKLMQKFFGMNASS